MNKSLPTQSDELLHLPGLIAKIEEQDCTLTAYKDAITQARTTIFELLGKGAPVDELLGWHSAVIDSVATHIWQRTISNTAQKSLALVAVGGYGRAELHPYSDIDILVLTENGYTKADEEIGQFVTHLWDLQLDLGHSVRDIDRCITEAKADINLNISGRWPIFLQPNLPSKKPGIKNIRTQRFDLSRTLKKAPVVFATFKRSSGCCFVDTAVLICAHWSQTNI